MSVVTLLPSSTKRALFTLLVIFLVLRPLRASDLLVRSWAPSQDARQRSVLALLEARDGYIWVATSKGLLRFDGVDFTSFTAANTPGMLGDRMSFGTLWEDDTGAIWAGTDFSGVVRNDHGHWQTLQEQQGLYGGKVLRIDGADDGAIWIYTETGVNRWVDGQLQRANKSLGLETPGQVVPFSRHRTIDFAKAGLWRHTSAGLERFALGHWAVFPTPVLSRPFEDDIREIYEDTTHRVWYSLFSFPRAAFCVDHGRLTRYEGLPPGALVTYQDRAGYLWTTDHNAHPSLWKGGHTYPLPELQAPFLLHVIETRNGTLWAGTAGTDLFQIRRRSIDVVPIAGAPEIASVFFQRRNGEIWAGGTEVLRHDTAVSKPLFQPVSAQNQPRHWIQIKALAENSDGELLIGSRGVEGIETLNAKGFVHSNAVQGTVQALLSTRTADVWVGSTRGLYRMQGHTAQQLTTVPVRCLLETRGGLLVAGSDQGPLLFQNGSEITSPSAPWTFGPVVATSQNRAGELWLVTQDHGLVIQKGTSFQTFGTPDGLPTNVIYGLHFDEADDLWMSSDIGLIRIRGKSIEEKRRDPSRWLRIKVFDATDGLPASIFDPLGNQATLRRPHGELWFSTEHGIAEIRPATLTTAPFLTRAIIEEHQINQSKPVPSGDIRLRPGQTDLQIHYTAIGSDHPEQLAFRYRLQNYDSNWVYAEGRRTAFYSHLPPGSYTFQVQAADNDGVGWDGNVASTSVQVLTPFYRSWWFLCLLSLTLGSLLIYQMEVRRRTVLAEQRNRQMFTHRLITTQEGERKRIAHELHDSIGQHLVLIRTLAMLPSNAAVALPGNTLDAIAEQAAVAIKEVETISYDLRPYQLDRLGLTKAVLSSIQTFERSSTVRIECDVDNIDGFFPQDLEINFYRIVQEALANILRHAEASAAKVKIERTGTSLRLTIQDDGKGFQTVADGQTSSLGLVGIQERAEALHGQATIESLPGIGTIIRVDAIQVVP